MPTTIHARRAPRSLAVVSAPRHYRWRSRIYAYGPYAKEIDLWAGLFDELRIVAPVAEQRPPGDAVALSARNVVLRPVLDLGGDSLGAKLKLLALLPLLTWQVARHLRESDAVHVRGPASLALVASLICPLLNRPMCAKYAGQWTPYEGERAIVKVQRWLLRRWFRGPVTVYGKTRNDPDHVVDFFTAMLTRSQIEQAISATQHKTLDGPLSVVFLGRLYEGKGLIELIEAVAKLAESEPVQLRIVGDGPLAPSARAAIAQLDLEENVSLLGSMPHDEALRQLSDAHVLVLASRHEGWPKVLTEAMVHHCLCVAPKTGLMARMIDGRGVALDGLTAGDIATALAHVQQNREQYSELLRVASAWAAHHSTEGLQTAIAEVLETHWQTRLSAGSASRI